MATITDTAQAPTPLSINEGASKGMKLNIKWSDINALGTFADNDTATFPITMEAGYMLTDVAVKLVTAFDDSGSGDELNVEVGLTGGDVDAYISTAALHTDQTEITYVANTGAALDNENGVVFTTADALDILITPNVSTGTDYSLNELTQGEFEVIVWYKDLNV